MTVACWMAGCIDAAFSAVNRQVTPRALRDRQEFEKSAFALMTDFGKAGILTEIAGKDCYISTRYRISSEIRSVNDGGIVYRGWSGPLGPDGRIEMI